MNTQLKIIYTGGTLGMQTSKSGLVPAPNLTERVNKALKQTPQAWEKLQQLRWEFIERHPLLDSANMLPPDWEALANDCKTISNADGIVIIHGTDTLAYTATALSYLLPELKIPVVITGSQTPLETKDSDALGNLVGAMHSATTISPGVWVYFDQKLMPGARVVKKDALHADGFATPKFLSPIRKPQSTLSWQSKPRPWSAINVSVLHMVPGFSAEQLKACLTNRPNAIILALYGLGSLPDRNLALLECLEKAQADKIVLVAVSQCYIAHIDFSVYAAGARLAEIGVLSGQDITLEAAYTKLMLSFRMGYGVEAIKTLFTRNTAGEIRHQHDE